MCDVFVAYNTDSIMKNLLGNVHQNGITRLRQHVIKKFEYEKTEFKTATLPWGSLSVPENINAIRKQAFESIISFYNLKKKTYNLYFDILDSTHSAAFTNHLKKNADIISKSEAVIFVVDCIEISFWQLQEAFFASYFNKKVLCLKTEDFLKLVNRGKIEKALDKLIYGRIHNKKK